MIGRSILAVVAGYFAMAICVMTITAATSFVSPAWSSPNNVAYVLFNLAYSAAFAVAGGYVTARVARRAELRHAMALAGLAFGLGMISLILYLGKQPLWYAIALLLVMPPAIVLGGHLRVREINKA